MPVGIGPTLTFATTVLVASEMTETVFCRTRGGISSIPKCCSKSSQRRTRSFTTSPLATTRTQPRARTLLVALLFPCAKLAAS